MSDANSEIVDVMMCKHIDLLCKCPALYLGEPSITRLKAYTLGYLSALEDAGFGYSKENIITRYSNWLRNTHMFSEGFSFERILLTLCGDDELKSLDMFCSQWNLFLEESRISASPL